MSTVTEVISSIVQPEEVIKVSEATKVTEPKASTSDYYQGLLLGKYGVQVPSDCVGSEILFDLLERTCGDFTRAFLILCEHPDKGELTTIMLKCDRVDPTYNVSECICTAVIHNNTPGLSLLLKDGRADPNARGAHFFVSAVNSGYVDCAKLLITDERADSLSYIKELVKCAHDKAGITKVKKLLVELVHTNVLGKVLLEVEGTRNVLFFDDLMAYPIAPNCRTRRAIQAALADNYDVVADYVNHGNKDFVEGALDFILRAACQGGSVRMVELLLGRGAEVDLNNYDSIVFVSTRGDKDLMTILLKRCRTDWAKLHDDTFIASLEARGGHARFLREILDQMKAKQMLTDATKVLTKEDQDAVNTDGSKVVTKVVTQVLTKEDQATVNTGAQPKKLGIDDLVEWTMEQFPWSDEARIPLALGISVGLMMNSRASVDNSDKLFGEMTRKFRFDSGDHCYFNVGLGLGLNANN